MVEVQYSEQASDLMEQFSLSTLIEERLSKVLAAKSVSFLKMFFL